MINIRKLMEMSGGMVNADHAHDQARYPTIEAAARAKDQLRAVSPMEKFVQIDCTLTHVPDKLVAVLDLRIKELEDKLLELAQLLKPGQPSRRWLEEYTGAIRGLLQ